MKLDTQSAKIAILDWYEILKSDEKQIILPRIQRKNVWDDKKNFQLLLTILKGYPFGIVTLSTAVTIDDSDKGKYFIVDGLQRSIAIRKSLIDFWKLISMDWKFFKEVIESVADDISDRNVQNNIYNYLVGEKNKKVISTLNLIFSKKLDFNIRSADIDLQDSNFRNIAKKLFDNLKNKKYGAGINEYEEMFIAINNAMKTKVSSSYLYYQIFDLTKVNDELEREAKINDAFSRINSKGMKLNNFDLLTAQWNNHKIKIVDDPNQSIVVLRTRKIYENDGDERSFLGNEKINDSISPSEFITASISLAIEKATASLKNNLFKNYFVSKNDYYNLENTNAFIPFIINIFSQSERPSSKDAKEIGDLIANRFNVTEKNISQEVLFEDFIESLYQVMVVTSISCYEAISLKNAKKNDDLEYGKKLSEGSFVMALMSSIWKKSVNPQNFKFNKNDAYLARFKMFGPMIYVHSQLTNEFMGNTIQKVLEIFADETYINLISTTNWPEKKFNVIEKMFEKSRESESENELTSQRNFDQVSKSLALFIFNNINGSVLSLIDNDFEFDHLLPISKSENIYGISTWQNASIVSKDYNNAKSNFVKKEYFIDDLLYKKVKEISMNMNMTTKIHTEIDKKWVVDHKVFRENEVSLLSDLKKLISEYDAIVQELILFDKEKTEHNIKKFNFEKSKVKKYLELRNLMQVAILLTVNL